MIWIQFSAWAFFYSVGNIHFVWLLYQSVCVKILVKTLGNIINMTVYKFGKKG